MKEVAVNIQAKSGPLHGGHCTLLEYAKSFGDPLAIISKNPNKWYTYVTSGQLTGIDEPEFDMAAQIDSAKAVGAKVVVHENTPINEDARSTVMRQATSLVNMYKDQLLSGRYINLAAFSIASMIIRAKSGIRQDYKPSLFIRGPELINFFIKSIGPLIGLTSTEAERYKIYPHIIKDPKYGIKAQSRLGALSPEYDDEIKRIPYIIAGIRSQYKIGNNIDLAREVQETYGRTIPLKLNEILVYEGGMVPGRLEVTAFSIHTNSGIIIVEDINYLC